MIITKGYLIKKSEYNMFDEIITFINEHGMKFTCFSQGSRKIKSKNARHLNFGDFLEFEFFYSENKISRLKKVSCISHIDDKYKTGWSLILINDLYSQIVIDNNKGFYELYQKVIDYLLSNYNDYILMLFISIQFLKLIKLSISSCSCDNKNKKINFEEMRLLCPKCTTSKKLFNENMTKLIMDIFNNDNLNITKDDSLDIRSISFAIKMILHFLYIKMNIYTEVKKII